MATDLIDDLAPLAQIVGRDRLATDLETREAMSGDLYAPGATAAAVIRPADADSLARAVGWAAGQGHAVVPRGGGLTYVGGYTPSDERSVIVDCRDLDRIVEVNAEDMYITVEAGVTWRRIHAALTPLGLRLPFFGTFSGAGATVGGGLSNGAMFLGSARYGSVAEIVLGLQVALADGTLLTTGQGGIANAAKPFFRTYGPDLTGLFVHDAGALGVKTRATFRLIKAPRAFDYLSFVFPDVGSAAAMLSAVGRDDLAEEVYIVDPSSTRQQMRQGTMFSDLAMLGKVVGQERGLLRGLKSGLELVRGGKDFLDRDLYSVHMTLAGRSRAAVEADVAAARAHAAAQGGTEIPNSVPKATRAMPFPDLIGVLGPEGDRWAALNCKVAHSDAAALIDGAEAIFAAHRPALDAAGVRVTLLCSAMSTHVFSYECVFRWHDRWTALHRSAHPAIASFTEPADNPAARAAIADCRRAVVDFFHDFGAASSQIGRTYRYHDALTPPYRALIEALKAEVDPAGRMNPGALGLGG